jgi:Do/DeqQ family serine protease
MKSRYLSLLLIIILGPWTGPAGAGAIPRDVSLAPLVKQVSPAVVNISTRGTREVQQDPRLQDPMFRRFFGIPDQPRERDFSSLGSGVIIDADEGLILTNAHVVREADEITISLMDGRQFKAEAVGADDASDVAVLKIEPDNLTELPIGSSADLEVGDYVLAVGNPFGLGQSVTSGIVSAKGRSGLGIESYEDFIQTDAAINRGNSGGALVNLQGELIGINTAILGPGGGSAGIGFAIPSHMARAVMEQILEFGEVKRGLLGVRGQELTPELAETLGLKRSNGAVISEVIEDSAAHAAGLQEYDVIIDADGRTVNNFQDLRNIVGLKRPGDSVTLRVLRDGEEFDITTSLGDNQQASVASPSSNELGGARLVAIPENHPLSGEIEGVMVDQVEPGSSAERQGLTRGDIVTSINRRRIRSVGDMARAIQGADRFLLRVQRGNAAFLVVIG